MIDSETIQCETPAYVKDPSSLDADLNATAARDVDAEEKTSRISGMSFIATSFSTNRILVDFFLSFRI